MKILSSTLIASLLLNGIALPVRVQAEDAAQACATDGFVPDPNASTPEKVPEKCGQGANAEACKGTRSAVLSFNKQYKELAEKACQKRRDSIKEINELNQSSSYDKIASVADAGKADIQALLVANDKILKKIPEFTDKNVAALHSIATNQAKRPQVAQFQAMLKRVSPTFGRIKQRPDAIKPATEGVQEKDASTISGLETAAGLDAKAQLEALGESQRFIRSLLMDKEKNEAAIRELDQAKAEAQKASKNTRTADGGTKSSDSGFNPMSLLPLAAPLAGLLMQQKQQSSGLSDPTTPTNPYGNTAPAPLAGTSLDPKSSGSQSIGAKLENPQKPDAQMHMPGETYAGDGGAVEPFGGDITNGNGESKSPVLGGAGSYSANSGGGASDSSGSSSTPGKAERKPASGTHSAGEEGLIGAGGGGGGYSAPADTAAEADGGMKDMLQDMEATLEDVPTGLFAEIDQQNSNGGVAPENSESLFPRVRACYVRNLKKGFVLNGLGEKLPESDSR